MIADESAKTRNNLFASVLSLFTSTGTLLCCALPALLVAIGAGAALSTLVSVFPGIVWVSENKLGVFAVAGFMLGISAYFQLRGRNAPCPVDPVLRNACLQTRKMSFRIYLVSVALFFSGAWFAFVQPLIT